MQKIKNRVNNILLSGYNNYRRVRNGRAKTAAGSSVGVLQRSAKGWCRVGEARHQPEGRSLWVNCPAPEQSNYCFGVTGDSQGSS